jgi:pyruvate carboxylase subunit B
MKKIRFMDTSFSDGFQSCYGARGKTDAFTDALKAAVSAGTRHFEIGGGARFQSLYFYCQEDAFDMMDACRKAVGNEINLQTLARGANVVGLISQSRDIIDLHAKLFKKHGVTTIRNFDALNDVRNLAYSGSCINKHGLKHQVVVSLMGLPPGLDNEYAHSPKFYIDRLKDILDENIEFDSVCFKDASGTATPKTIFETVKEARKILPGNTTIQVHSHSTAGLAVSCYMAAIEAGADVIDLAMSPVSGGTCQPDILTMWHRLKGTDYTLDIDYEKILKAEEVFEECMSKYFKPPEADKVSPLITLSPMPGGALTANTQMMRDNNCLHLYPEVIKAMREVVERGGFGTSVTPVSQFYFQQAFANVTQGKWEKITEGYGKMVLGYFGHTPAEPDSEIVALAAEQLGLEPTKEDVHDINDDNPELGIEAASKKLADAGLEINDENIFITATCGDKGIEFLKGNKPLGIRYAEDEKKSAPATAPAAAAAKSSGPESYTVTVNGTAYNVHVAPGGATSVAPAAAAPAPAAAPSGNVVEINAPMPGTVIKILVNPGDVVAEGDTVVIIEAMKMETEVKAHAAGTVADILVDQGAAVAANQVMVTLS